MTTARVARLALVPILLAYAALACGYALVTPRWNNPDEPAHFNYVAHLARTGTLPVLRAGDWDSAALGRCLQSGRFSCEPIDGFRYEAHQPPLYYALVSPLYLATQGLGPNARVVALRLASVGLGLLLLIVVWSSARLFSPPWSIWLAPLATSIVAFIPMHTAMTAAINNDTLAELLASLMLLVALRGLRVGFGPRSAALVGLLGGLLLLTKLTVYPYVLLGLGALVAEGCLARDGRLASRRVILARVLLALAVAGLLAGWWFLRNLLVYGWPDLFGLIRHDQVVVGQPRWGGVGEGLESVRFFLYSIHRSFWAQFGWMAVVVDPPLERPYWLLLGSLLLSVGGLVGYSRSRHQSEASFERRGLVLLLAALALVWAELVVYNLSFIQAQGRYLFPAILPISVLGAAGWMAAANPAVDSSRWRRLGPGLAVYLTLALTLESLCWLLLDSAATLWLHAPLLALSLWRGDRLLSGQPDGARPAMLLALGLLLTNAAALLRFVQPYFKGW